MMYDNIWNDKDALRQEVAMLRQALANIEGQEVYIDVDAELKLGTQCIYMARQALNRSDVRIWGAIQPTHDVTEPVEARFGQEGESA